MFLCVKDQKMESFEIAQRSSQLTIDHQRNQLIMHVRGLNLEFSLDYSLWSDPAWLKDEGSGSIKIQNADI